MDDDIDSSCSTPFASAPSSPGRSPPIGGGYFFSAPASPIHHLLLSSSSASSGAVPGAGFGGVGDPEFEFGGPGGPMISADELFHNGQIRPLTLSPLPDLDPGSDDDGGDGDCRPAPVRGRELTLRSGSVHRRTRSMSPLRGASPRLKLLNALVPAPDLGSAPSKSEEATPPVTASSRSSSSSSTSSSSSASSSARGGSRRWVFLKDMLLHRSKSEPHAAHDAPNSKPEKAWPFSPSTSWASSRDRITAKLRAAARPPQPQQQQTTPSSDSGGGEEVPQTTTTTRGRARGKGRRRSTTVAAAHERLYAAPNRAQAEEMRRRTFLPYRQGLLGCLGFSSRGYGALHGFTKTLNPVFSR
uniref:Uncharacterized protein n=1 Tax=Leersia perrieri TaxID=77586 RepID=A0A0D9VT43_9ORYZ